MTDVLLCLVAGMAALTPVYLILYRVEARLTRIECLLPAVITGD